MYIEDLLAKKLTFDLRPLLGRWGVYEKIKREDVEIDIGCVFVGTPVQCREYIGQRRSQQELKAEERRGQNPMIDRYDRKYMKKDGVIQWG